MGSHDLIAVGVVFVWMIGLIGRIVYQVWRVSRANATRKEVSARWT